MNDAARHTKSAARATDSSRPKVTSKPIRTASTVPSPPGVAGIILASREMAKAAGFNIKVETMAHGTYLKQVWKKGDFYVGFYNMQPTEDALFKLLLTSDAVWNETRWNNKEVDGLVNAARTTTDTAKRKTLYADAQKLMQKELPILVPVFFDLLGASRSYVENYNLHPRGATFSLEKVTLGAGAPKR